MSLPSIESVIGEATSLAFERGIGGTRPPRADVVADRSNLVLRLTPQSEAAGTVGADDERLEPVIARVAMATSMVRVGMAWLRREVEVSQFLAERGAPVTVPYRRIDPGPHERNGLVISFWQAEDVVADHPEPREAGHALARVHRQLADYPKDGLPPGGGFEEAREVFERLCRNRALEETERRRLERAWADADRIVASAAQRTASFQAIHGDAHVRNVMATKRGMLWTDWEDAFTGPVEWDIACLRSKAELFGEDRETIAAMLEAYDAPWDAGLAQDLGLARNLQVIVWLAVFAERQPGHLERMRDRIAKLP